MDEHWKQDVEEKLGQLSDRVQELEVRDGVPGAAERALKHLSPEAQRVAIPDHIVRRNAVPWEAADAWPEVDVFALDMRKELAKNVAKGKSWKLHTLRSLSRRILEEALELQKVVDVCEDLNKLSTAMLEDLLEEAADVGNMAMMLSDRARILAASRK